MALTNDAPTWNHRGAGHLADLHLARSLPTWPGAASLEGCLLATAVFARPAAEVPPLRDALAADLRDAYGRLASCLQFQASPGGRLD